MDNAAMEHDIGIESHDTPKTSVQPILAAELAALSSCKSSVMMYDVRE
jgi:hypothetical protein